MLHANALAVDRLTERSCLVAIAVVIVVFIQNLVCPTTVLSAVNAEHISVEHRYIYAAALGCVFKWHAVAVHRTRSGV